MKKEAEKTLFLFPVGKINGLKLLYNRNETLYRCVVEAYENQEALSQPEHELAMDLLYQFLMIRGMPEALDIYDRRRCD